MTQQHVPVQLHSTLQIFAKDDANRVEQGRQQQSTEAVQHLDRIVVRSREQLAIGTSQRQDGARMVFEHTLTAP